MQVLHTHEAREGQAAGDHVLTRSFKRSGCTHKCLIDIQSQHDVTERLWHKHTHVHTNAIDTQPHWLHRNNPDVLIHSNVTIHCRHSFHPLSHTRTHTHTHTKQHYFWWPCVYPQHCMRECLNRMHIENLGWQHLSHRDQCPLTPRGGGGRRGT